MLQMLEQRDHPSGQQAVGAADIGFAGLLGERLGSGLGPAHALAGQLGNVVDKDDPLRDNHLDQVRICRRNVLVVVFGKERARVGRRIHAADQALDVDRIQPAADWDAVARLLLDALHAGLEVDAMRARAWRWQRMLDDGVCATVAEIAEAEGIYCSYVSRVLRLTLLAPHVVERVIEGHNSPPLAGLLTPALSA